MQKSFNTMTRSRGIFPYSCDQLGCRSRMPVPLGPVVLMQLETLQPSDSSASPDFYGTLSENRRNGLRTVEPPKGGE